MTSPCNIFTYNTLANLLVILLSSSLLACSLLIAFSNYVSNYPSPFFNSSIAAALSSLLATAAGSMLVLMNKSQTKDTLKPFLAYICVSSALAVGASITTSLDLFEVSCIGDTTCLQRPLLLAQELNSPPPPPLLHSFRIPPTLPTCT